MLDVRVVLKLFIRFVAIELLALELEFLDERSLKVRQWACLIQNNRASIATTYIVTIEFIFEALLTNRGRAMFANLAGQPYNILAYLTNALLYDILFYFFVFINDAFF